MAETAPSGDGVRCPVCGSNAGKQTAVRLAYGRIGTCLDCGSGILEPRPSQTQLSGLHSTDDYFDHPYFEQRRHMTPEAEAIAEARLRRSEAMSGPLTGKRLVDVGRSGYSSLAAGRHGTPAAGWIFLHYEHDPFKGAHLARFNLAWVLGGEPTGDGEVPELKRPDEDAGRLRTF